MLFVLLMLRMVIAACIGIQARRWNMDVGTTKYEKRGVAVSVPIWIPENVYSVISVLMFVLTQYPSFRAR